MQPKTFALALACALLAAASAQAATVLPSHYNMPNGYGQAEGGGRNYWDLSYSGSGNRMVGYSPLTDGLGDLSDGVIATERWDVVENDAGTGPYVGWNHMDAWRIEFHFAQSHVFSEVVVWHDDANGWGDISPPATILVTAGGMSQLFDIADPASEQPFGSVLTLGPGFSGQVLTLEVMRRNNGFMLSEVQFSTAAVPEPGTWALALLGLGVLGAQTRRAARKSAGADALPSGATHRIGSQA